MINYVFFLQLFKGPNLRFDFQPETEYLARYPAGYRMSGQPEFHIRQNTGYKTSGYPVYL